MKNIHKKYIPILFIALLFIRVLPVLALWLYSASNTVIALSADPYLYLGGAQAMLHGEVNPSNFFPPLNFLFIALFLYIGNENILFAMTAMSITGWLSIILVYILTEKIFNQKTAFIAALISGLYPNFIFYGLTFYAETLTIFLMLLSLVTLVIFLQKRTSGHLVLSGILWGMVSQSRGGLHLCAFFISAVLVTCLSGSSRFYRIKTIIIYLVPTYATIVTVGYMALPLHGNTAINAKSGVASAALGVNRIAVPCTDYGDVDGNFYYKVNHCSGEKWPEGSEINPLYIIELSTSQAATTLAGFVLDDPRTFVKHSVKKISCLWSPNQYLIGFIKKYYYVHPLFVDSLCFIVALLYTIIMISGICGMVIGQGILKKFSIMFISFNCVLIFLTVGNSKLRLTMMPFLIIFSASFMYSVLAGCVQWKRIARSPIAVTVVILFMCNSVYRYRDISLAPAEVHVRILECCARYHFPETARCLLNTQHFNKWFTDEQKQRIQTVGRLLSIDN